MRVPYYVGDLTRDPTVDDINPALPIIRKESIIISHSVGSLR